MIRWIRYHYRWYLFRWLAPKRFQQWYIRACKEVTGLIGKQASKSLNRDYINWCCRNFLLDDTWTVWGAVNVEKKEER